MVVVANAIHAYDSPLLSHYLHVGAHRQESVNEEGGKGGGEKKGLELS